ncbi:hypothetical protein AB0M54_29040 [Actinoplanes sp. NPDC051470]|uniref:hypothetical protein n=1 Tax=Actinoplanes sp. NPDC051470 TaxID=3157224 RepID=UPI0034305C44
MLSSTMLLAAYPARLRRRHGAELLTTLAEMTDGRPTRADRLRLVVDGVRERFRLPARWPLGALVAAFVMLAGGAVGLAVGSFAGEQAHPALPAPATLVPQILGASARPDVLEGDRFSLAITERLGTATPIEPEVRAIHQRLAAAGWDVTAIDQHRDLDQWGFWAQSGDLRVSIEGYPDENHPVAVLGYPVRPASYLPLVLGGLLVGLIAGWPVGAALAHRLAATRHLVPALVVAALGAVLAVVPVGRLYQGLVLFLTDDDGFGVGALVHNALAWMPWPLRDTSQFPDSPWPGVRTLLLGLALIALAATVALRPRPGEAETATATAAGGGLSQEPGPGEAGPATAVG